MWWQPRLRPPTIFYQRRRLKSRAIMRMRTIGLFILCLASIPAQSSGLPQTDSLALKSQRAKQLMADGNFAQAIPIYRELNQAVPNNPGLILNLGMALHMAGKEREAVSELEAAVKLDPKSSKNHYGLAQVYRKLGRGAEAAREVRLFQNLKAREEKAFSGAAGTGSETVVPRTEPK